MNPFFFIKLFINDNYPSNRHTAGLYPIASIEATLGHVALKNFLCGHRNRIVVEVSIFLGCSPLQ